MGRLSRSGQCDRRMSVPPYMTPWASTRPPNSTPLKDDRSQSLARVHPFGSSIPEAMPCALCAKIRLLVSRAQALSIVLLATLSTGSFAQEKKLADTPRIIAAAPLEVTTGGKTTLLLRGIKLDTA